MTTNYRIVLLATIVAVTGIAVFPPRVSDDGARVLPRGFLFSKHLYKANYHESGHKTVADDEKSTTTYYVEYDIARIAIGRMLAEIVIVLGVGMVLFLLLRRKEATEPVQVVRSQAL